MVAATLATWYSSFLIASLWNWDGKKHVTYRHLAHSIFGTACSNFFIFQFDFLSFTLQIFPCWILHIHLFLCNYLEGFWGYWSIAFFQQVASVGNNIAIHIAAGNSLKVGSSDWTHQSHIAFGLCRLRLEKELYCICILQSFVAGCLQILWQGWWLNPAAFYYFLWGLWALAVSAPWYSLLEMGKCLVHFQHHWLCWHNHWCHYL